MQCAPIAVRQVALRTQQYRESRARVFYSARNPQHVFRVTERDVSAAVSVPGVGMRCCGEERMTWDEVQAQWDEYGPQLLDRWGRLTEEDVARARGGRDELIECVLQRYRLTTDLAQRHVDGWLNSIG